MGGDPARSLGVTQNNAVSLYKPMRLHLETARLRLQPWDESDAEDLRALHSERVNLTRTPNVERTRKFIAEGMVRTAATGLAVLPIRRCPERVLAPAARPPRICSAQIA